MISKEKQIEWFVNCIRKKVITKHTAEIKSFNLDKLWNPVH